MVLVLDSHALLRINAHEDAFLPVEVKVDWLTSQASMRSRASAMVGSRISQLDDAIRVRALLSIIRSGAPLTAEESKSTTTPPPSVPSSTTPTAGTAAAAGNEEASKAREPPAQASAKGREGAGAQAPRGHVRTESAAETPPAPADLELFTRMAVAKMKAVLFQLASDAEKKERRGKDVFDVYEGLVTSEALEKAAEAGFPALDVDTILLPKHFHYRTLIAARHRYLLRKLGVLLDMEDGVESLLELAADTETLQDSLADVDLSAGEIEGGEDEEDEDEDEDEERDVQPPRSRKGSASASASASLAASSLLMSPSSKAASAAAAASASAGGAASGALKAKAIPTLRDTSWDKDVGNEDATEGETDEESPNGTPQVVHRRTGEVSPSH
eukprot:g5667.t1